MTYAYLIYGTDSEGGGHIEPHLVCHSEEQAKATRDEILAWLETFAAKLRTMSTDERWLARGKAEWPYGLTELWYDITPSMQVRHGCLDIMRIPVAQKS